MAPNLPEAGWCQFRHHEWRTACGISPASAFAGASHDAAGEASRARPRSGRQTRGTPERLSRRVSEQSMGLGSGSLRSLAPANVRRPSCPYIGVRYFARGFDPARYRDIPQDGKPGPGQVFVRCMLSIQFIDLPDCLPRPKNEAGPTCAEAQTGILGGS